MRSTVNTLRVFNGLGRNDYGQIHGVVGVPLHQLEGPFHRLIVEKPEGQTALEDKSFLSFSARNRLEPMLEGESMWKTSVSTGTVA